MTTTSTTDEEARDYPTEREARRLGIFDKLYYSESERALYFAEIVKVTPIVRSSRRRLTERWLRQRENSTPTTR